MTDWDQLRNVSSNCHTIQKLVSIATPAIGDIPAPSGAFDFRAYGPVAAELEELFEVRSGFYAFESALHVFPVGFFRGEMTLGRWNSHGLWLYEYNAMVDNALFFAEDGLGTQFCIRNGRIV